MLYLYPVIYVPINYHLAIMTDISTIKVNLLKEFLVNKSSIYSSIKINKLLEIILYFTWVNNLYLLQYSFKDYERIISLNVGTFMYCDIDNIIYTYNFTSIMHYA